LINSEYNTDTILAYRHLQLSDHSSMVDKIECKSLSSSGSIDHYVLMMGVVSLHCFYLRVARKYIIDVNPR